LIIANNGLAYAVSGTSISAPLWAGFTALVNEMALANGSP
jgi:subtilase family serine protease